MLSTVLLLLSVFTVRGSACDELQRQTVSNWQGSIKREEQKGFPEVFPKNYYVQHHFNGSTQCEDSCCVFSAAFLLSDAWKYLLQHIERVHMKYTFIVELIIDLDNIWKGSFQDTPNPSAFPSVHSSPRTLLTFTSDVFSKWLDLNCPDKNFSCVFASPAPLFTDEQKEPKAENSADVGGLVEQESQYGKEGEREKRWLTITPKNGDRGLSASLGFFICILCCLRLLLDVMLNELG
ncbi:uncharacterized protein Hap1MRO34_005022 [Clarias gariepinus]|uniref:uncharacterized protein zgc:174888 n=1 Tax=Clarias gariepinus TaxID=13013 RepID=UPI00234C3C64|nr:uncharacterized protein zgc:174888 [Clarias gariepinus]